MSFDLGPTHAAFWGTLTANPWRLVTAAAGSAVVVAGVGVLLATPVAAVAPAVLALHYAAGASAAGGLDVGPRCKHVDPCASLQGLASRRRATSSLAHQSRRTA